MNNKTQGIVSIIAAMVVLFSAMWDPNVSIGLAVLGLLTLGIWQILAARKEQSMAVTRKENRIINSEQVAERQEHLQKIFEMAGRRDYITNDEVEKTLQVSDTTAARYLQELSEQGKLIQIGSRGPQVLYKRKQ
jgi:Fic family protein